GWAPQRRSASVSAYAAFDPRVVLATGAGLVAMALSLALAEPWWVWPIALPCALAVPTALWLASPGWARGAQRLGVFRTEAEAKPTPVTRALARHRGYFHADEACRFRDLILDPALCQRLRARATEAGGHDEVSDTQLVEKA